MLNDFTLSEHGSLKQQKSTSVSQKEKDFIGLFIYIDHETIREVGFLFDMQHVSLQHR